MRAATALERNGIPSASIIITGFLPQGNLIAKSQGINDLVMCGYPDTMMTDSDEQLFEKVTTVVADQVAKGLTNQSLPNRKQKEIREPEQKDIIFEGSMIEVNDYFYNRLWTDGLPVMPPTIEAVEEFLRFTDRDSSEVIAVLPHENREATIWNIAVNGVMAGCRPEYMPVLIAIIEAISEDGDPGNPSDGGFRPQDIGTTPGWEPLVIVNGPIARQLDFNSGQGILRFGKQSNTSIGRFLKLFIRNVCGYRIAPGNGDKGSIGQSMNVAIAENEEFVDEIGWTPYQVERGFDKEDSIVTVMSSAYVSAPCYTSGDTALAHLDTLVDQVGRKSFGLFATWGPHTGRFEPMLLIAPPVAKRLAEEGWTKADVKKYFFEQTKTTADVMEKHWQDFNGANFDMCAKVREGRLPSVYCECEDPKREIPVFLSDNTLQIIVGGDPARAQSKGFTQSGYIGPPISKKIELPKNWTELTQ
ncbi:hypothetical protein M2150_000180 [Lachnospiraceae bacterium PM6-15]